MTGSDPRVDRVVGDLVAALGESLVLRQAPLGPLTTYRVGGPAAAMITIADDAQLDLVAGIIAGTGVPILSVGLGSNLLVADSGFSGVVVQLGQHFARVDIDSTSVSAGAAAKLPVVARYTVQCGLTGFEWAVGVPGTIGGAVRMNAGGHGAEMSDSLVSIRLVDFDKGEVVSREAALLELGYRSSALGVSELVIGADLELAPGAVEVGQEKVAKIIRWRRTHQPGGHNAGSVFTNPPGDSAGRLIDTAGARGLRIGTAAVSSKHANFIQADEDGSACDIRAVMTEVQRRVLEVHGIELHTETHLIGFEDEGIN